MHSWIDQQQGALIARLAQPPKHHPAHCPSPRSTAWLDPGLCYLGLTPGKGGVSRTGHSKDRESHYHHQQQQQQHTHTHTPGAHCKGEFTGQRHRRWPLISCASNRSICSAPGQMTHVSHMCLSSSGPGTPWCPSPPVFSSSFLPGHRSRGQLRIR